MQFLGAALGSLPLALLTEGVPAAPTGAGVVLAVVALALAGTLAPFTLFAFGQSRVSAEVAGAFLNLEPLVGAIAGTMVFGDPVGLVQVAGGLAILAGIALSSLPLIAAGRMARRAAAVACGQPRTSARGRTPVPRLAPGAQARVPGLRVPGVWARALSPGARARSLPGGRSRPHRSLPWRRRESMNGPLYPLDAVENPIH